MTEKIKIKIKWLAVVLAFSFLASILTAGNAYCHDDFSVGGFIDEDGDGFNDLLPDSDGDGVPDGLDPDSEINLSDSGYMHRYMHNRQEQHQMMWENMNGHMQGGHMEHGEPGMFGPGDSTMHGGHDGSGHHHGGGMDHGGGMGPGMGGGPNSVGNQLTDPNNTEPIPNMMENKSPVSEHLKDKNNQGLDKSSRGDNPGGE